MSENIPWKGAERETGFGVFPYLGVVTDSRVGAGLGDTGLPYCVRAEEEDEDVKDYRLLCVGSLVVVLSGFIG